ncbi:hypothetical protein AB0M43_05255 [Longispora sp. NPDC051575]|uniref:hypothetical protein n=1 Tax=Longispora sp. NPDC051575 TaxID=3154943 RepID=UPI00341DA28D
MTATFKSGSSAFRCEVALGRNQSTTTTAVASFALYGADLEATRKAVLRAPPG